MRRNVLRSRIISTRLLAVAVVALALGASFPAMGQTTFGANTGGYVLDRTDTAQQQADTSLDWTPAGKPVTECGNGIAEPGEGCDPGNPAMGIPPDLRGKTCESEGGYNAGELACKPNCKVDDSACFCGGGTSFPATGQTTCWDAGGRVIDCTGTGHDGDIRAGAPLSYTDNGDGTITDNNTLLMWEKKDDSEGIHDKDTEYMWGDTFSVFIDSLNNTCEGDGLVQCDSDDLCGVGGQCGFAGYRDWRMPNVKELQSIVNYEVWIPAVSAEFNTNCVSGCTVLQCSCTRSAFYWSSSSHPRYANSAWGIYFYYGSMASDGKTGNDSVRAVRGGL